MANLEQECFFVEQKEKLSAKKVVIKIGSSSLVGEEGLRLDILDNLADQIAGLYSRGVQVAIVSSGAVALGRHILNEKGVSGQNKNLAAVFGQARLISEWERVFSLRGILCGQLLVRDNDLGSLKQVYEGLKIGVVVINGNDAISDNAIDTETRDNDNLACLFAAAIGANSLIYLTNVDGVLALNGEVISELGNQALVFGEKSSFGTGGMQSKVNAASCADQMGIQTTIVGASISNVLDRVLQGENIGTRVYYQKGGE